MNGQGCKGLFASLPADPALQLVLPPVPLPWQQPYPLLLIPAVHPHLRLASVRGQPHLLAAHSILAAMHDIHVSQQGLSYDLADQLVIQ